MIILTIDVSMDVSLLFEIMPTYSYSTSVIYSTVLCVVKSLKRRTLYKQTESDTCVSV